MIANPTILRQPNMDQLVHLSSLLHLFHHRNNNQHRRSIWYRHFLNFRRHLTKILALYTIVLTVPTTHIERILHQARLPDLQVRIAQTSVFWQDVLVPKWNHSFGQLVADGQFAILGIVLTGALASVCGILGVSKGLEGAGKVLEQAEQDEFVRVLEEFGRETWDSQGAKDRPAIVVGDHLPGRRLGDDDLGIPFERTPEDMPSRPVITHATKSNECSAVVLPDISPHDESHALSKEPKRMHEAATQIFAPTKKKRRKNNAIDDLFGGL